MWKLNLGWDVVRIDGGLKFFSDAKAFHVTIPEADAEILLEYGGFVLKDEESGRSYSELAKSLSALGAITRFNPDAECWGQSLQSRYFLHTGADPTWIADNLANSAILILGLGGTGSVVLEHVAPSGLGRFILVDDDIVEASNLERQLMYNARSIGHSKVHCASRHVLDRNPNAHIDVFETRIESKEVLFALLDKVEKIDACAVCIDHPPDQIFDIASSVLWERNIPFVHGGVMCRSGFWGPFFSRTHGSPEPKKFSIWNVPSQKTLHPNPAKICFSPYNAIIAGFMAADLLHFLSGVTHYVDFKERTFFNFNTCTQEKIPCR